MFDTSKTAVDNPEATGIERVFSRSGLVYVCFAKEFRTMATEAVQKKRKIRESDAKILKDDLERCENL